MKKYIAVFGICFFLLGIVFVGNDVFAQDNAQLFPSWGGEEPIAGVIGDNADGKLAVNYFGRITDILIKFVTPLFLVFLIAAGVKMIVAGDNTEEVEKGKKVILYGVIGVIVIILSYSLVQSLYYFFVDGEGTPAAATAYIDRSVLDSKSVAVEFSPDEKRSSDSYL